MKKYIIAIAAIAVMAPAGTAWAGAEYKIDNNGPSASLGGLLGGGGSGGEAIQIFGQEIEGIESQGSARHRFEAEEVGPLVQNGPITFREELKVKTDDLDNPEDGATVVYFSLSEILNGFLFNSQPLPNGVVDGDKAELDYKYQGAAESPALPISHCGDVILGLPLYDSNLANLLVATVAPDGDVGTGFLGALAATFWIGGRPQVFCPVADQQQIPA